MRVDPRAKASDSKRFHKLQPLSGLVVMSGGSASLWPLGKIERNLTPQPRGRRCVLLSTGALNPVHVGHVAMFDKAKHALETHFGFEVVGGFLSPSHDLYLDGKKPIGRTFPAEQRLNMCAAATRNHQHLAVGSWESSAVGRWPDFPEVKAELEQVLRHEFGEDAPEVVYVCGADHFPYAKDVVSPVCAVGRSGVVVHTDETRGIYAVEIERDDPHYAMSSTRVREALVSRDYATLRSHLHPDVLALLCAYVGWQV
ncbi:hypothetical protein DVS77_18875 [Mycolicibacterium moriokaense]|nr:hypothetical protein DVS77_18875 [Mycolicibacterium moriokaense]